MNFPLPLAACAFTSTLLAATVNAVDTPDLADMRKAVVDALARHPGHFLTKAELDDHRGSFVYEVEVANDQGQEFELRYDAATGAMIREKAEHDDDFRGIPDVQPYTAIIDRAQAMQPGNLREIELDDERERWVYEIRLESDDGVSHEVRLDAVTGESITGWRD